MKGALITLLLVLLAGILITAYFYAGAYNIATSEPHTDLVSRFLSGVLTNSVRTHAAGIEVPQLVFEALYGQSGRLAIWIGAEEK